jgi:hypothetical protein
MLQSILGGGETFLVGRKFFPKRQFAKKLWLPNQARRKMVLGDDLGLEEAVNLALTALVGRFSYRSRCYHPIAYLDEGELVTFVRIYTGVIFPPARLVRFQFSLDGGC